MADILAILLTPDPRGEASLRVLRERYPGANLILLTTPEAALRLAPLADEVWSEGGARGPGRLLALLRRIAWMSFAHVHDLERSRFTRLMRFFVWPRPHWHREGLSR